MWFELNGDARLGRCDSDRCGGQPTWRLEAGGVGSNYCSGCKEKIVTIKPRADPPTKGQGEAVNWLRDRMDYSDAKCLTWPFFRMPTGYGSFGYLGKQHYAHRFMCELAHGEAPT